MTIEKINSNSPTNQKIEEVNDMVIEADGKIAQANFNKNEIDQIFTDTGLKRQFIRNRGVGDTTATYVNWTHVQSEDGYSIWSYIPATYKYNALNKLYCDNKELVNKGEASSEIATAFEYVYLYDAEIPSGTTKYTNNTTEAGTENGTAFNLMNSTGDYILLGSATPFYGAKFEFYTRGSYYDLKVEYFNGVWTELTLGDHGFVDNTNDFQGNGTITWDSTKVTDWTQYTENGSLRYWIRISTNTVPTTVATAYYLIPNTSVIGMLALSATEVLNEEWAWCYYNGSIYVTIRNTGNVAYDGNFFINSVSTLANKKNYFVYNHQFTADYEDSTYTTGMTITLPETAIADASMANGTLHLWVDESSGVNHLMFKVKYSDGSVRSGSIDLA